VLVHGTYRASVCTKLGSAAATDDDVDDIFSLLTLPLPPYPLLAARRFDVVLGVGNLSMIVFPGCVVDVMCCR